jgi:hypothetical protein
MASENANVVHAQIALGRDAQENLIVKVCRGIDLASIAETSPGVVELDLVEALGDSEAVLASRVDRRDPWFLTAVMVEPILDRPTHWRIITFRAANSPQDGYGPMGADVTWFRATGGAGPVTLP